MKNSRRRPDPTLGSIATPKAISINGVGFA